MDLFELFEISQINAIHDAFSPSIESIWRIKCREYSQKYHTPLHVVLNELEPAFVLQQLNEDIYRPGEINEDIEEVLHKLYAIKDPNYTPISSEETEDLVDAVMQKEINRMAKKKRPTQD